MYIMIAPDSKTEIDDGRHAVVGADRQEGRLELIAPADVAGHDPIGQAALLQQNRDLLAVGRGPEMQVDHRLGGSLGSRCV
jgi:hypothetical protein